VSVEDSLKKFVKHFGVVLDARVVVRGKRAYHVPLAVEEVVGGVKGEAYQLGVPLGELTSKGFVPSFELLDRLKDSENKVVIGEDAVWLFLCGRDIFEVNVSEDSSTAEQFLVTNEQGEVLGLGSWSAHRGKRVVKNVLDRGDFLRREDKRKNHK
jgi:ribosome biogenesis protein Nip4